MNHEPFRLTEEQKQACIDLGDKKLALIVNNYNVTGIAIVGTGWEFDSNGKHLPYKRFWQPEDGTALMLTPNPIPPKDCKIEYEYFDERPISGFYVFSSTPQPHNFMTDKNLDNLGRYQVYDSNEKTVFEFPSGFPLKIDYERLNKLFRSVEKLIFDKRPGYTVVLWKNTPHF